MKSKKSPKVDLEPKRGLFLEIGLLLALGLCLAAFEWPSSGNELANLGNLDAAVEFEEEIASTFIKDPPPPPEKEEPINPDPIFDIVDDDVETEDIEFISDLLDSNPPVINDDMEDVPDEETGVEDVPYYKVEDKPTFPGGEKEMFKFFSETTVYPEIPKENRVDGTVYVQFVITETGNVVNPIVIGKVDPYLDAEALRVVSLFPTWTPGKQRGIPVRVTRILPIAFVLE